MSHFTLNKHKLSARRGEYLLECRGCYAFYLPQVQPNLVKGMSFLRRNEFATMMRPESKLRFEPL